MDKKGAELAFNVIVIAIIAIIVMAVILFIFGGKVGTFKTGLKDCASMQGTCSGVPKTEGGKITSVDCGGKGAPVLGTNCEPLNGCCISL